MTELQNRHGNPCEIGYEVAGPMRTIMSTHTAQNG